MTIRGIQQTAHSLSYYARLQEVTANNLANVSTDAFKMDRLTGTIGKDGEFPIPTEATDLRQGSVRDTGRDFDVALEGDGFLVVKTANGERLTRGGSLRLDNIGQLTDVDGNAILGKKGPITVPHGKFSIDRDGTVMVDGGVLDTLRLETVADPTQLRKEGAGRFLPGGKTLDVKSGLTVRQGAIEDANADAVMGMIDLVTIQRAYSANVDCLKAMDGVLGTITGDVGRA